MRVKLGDVAIENRETLRGNKAGMPVVGLEHLIPGELMLTEWDTDSKNTFTKSFHKGQVLFGRRRAYLKKASIASVDGICSGDITVIEAKPDKLLPELFPFIIQNDAFFDFAVGKSAGSLSPRAKWEQLQNFELNLPPIDEQCKLADLLWAAVEVRNAYKKLLAKTDELVKSQFIEMFGDTVTNPMGWKICKLGDIAEAVDPQPSHRTPPVSDDGIPYVGVAECDYETRQIDFGRARKVGRNVLEEQCNRYSISDGDFIIGKIGTIGKPFFVPIEQTYTLSANTVLIKPFAEKVQPTFLLKQFQTELIENQLSVERMATSQPAFGIQKVRNISLLLPPLPLQNRFANFMQQVDKSKFELQRTLDNLDATYKVLLRENLG